MAKTLKRITLADYAHSLNMSDAPTTDAITGNITLEAMGSNITAYMYLYKMDDGTYQSPQEDEHAPYTLELWVLPPPAGTSGTHKIHVETFKTLTEVMGAFNQASSTKPKDAVSLAWAGGGAFPVKLDTESSVKVTGVDKVNVTLSDMKLVAANA